MKHQAPRSCSASALYLGRSSIAARAALRQRRQERRLQAAERVQARALDHIKLGGIDLSINRAVLYLVLASALTISAMVWISRRMQQKPNKVQTAVELAYDLTSNNITGGNLDDERLASRWFPFLATLFFFIWFSNMIGYIPLPTNTEETIDIFGARDPRLRALRGDRQHLDPAGPDPGRLGLLPRRGDPGEGLHPLLEELAARRASRT